MDARIGTSGWTYKHWRGTFYPQGLRIADQLDHYTERFRTVELNGSHYRWPADSTVEAWRERLPAGFEMAVKASRYLTHYRKLNEPQDWVKRIVHTLDLLGDHAGPLLLQLPATCTATTTDSPGSSACCPSGCAWRWRSSTSPGWTRMCSTSSTGTGRGSWSR